MAEDAWNVDYGAIVARINESVRSIEKDLEFLATDPIGFAEETLKMFADPYTYNWGAAAVGTVLWRFGKLPKKSPTQAILVVEESEITTKPPNVPAVKNQGTAGGPRAGKNFTAKGEKVVIDANRTANRGVVKCEECKIQTVPAKKSMKGVTPPKNETQVDHIIPKSMGGDGALSNGQVLCRGCNRAQSNKYPNPKK